MLLRTECWQHQLSYQCAGLQAASRHAMHPRQSMGLLWSRVLGEFQTHLRWHQAVNLRCVHLLVLHAEASAQFIDSHAIQLVGYDLNGGWWLAKNTYGTGFAGESMS